jgi:sigma-B regulation protein RsbU (phosphoserine phosphatase)
MLHPNQLSWIEDDLVKARTMLERFTPIILPSSSGIDCGAGCRQLFYIGGDYYDFLSHPNQSSVFAIGDVSGKGISAALMLANLRAVLHDEMQQDRVNLAGMLSKLNRLVHAASPEGSFITFFYAQYDPVRSRLHYVNAGHNPPLLFRSLSKNKTPKELSVGGLPLGAMLNPPIAFEQGTENLRPGDVLIVCTDGITEITNRSQEEWGVNRLIDTIQRHSDLPSQEIVKQVFNAIDKYSEGTEPVDDMTLIILKALR